MVSIKLIIPAFVALVAAQGPICNQVANANDLRLSEWRYNQNEGAWDAVRGGGIIDRNGHLTYNPGVVCVSYGNNDVDCYTGSNCYLQEGKRQGIDNVSSFLN
ncbi:hypothetical protein BS50DRAFT_676303 [Corynespora cassiicola Philippines]|uniref:Uncharacterized protein n=1 Tax=Corynespora cassiicola Philippines TaxID=1448308 RepID=A0A2T2NTQ4_CORCC|nr:hypothetical protein BS50DRAFT_676303 [Corynespora cassiicola Philippines]